MNYVPLGKTGLNVSRFGMGCMRFSKDEKEAVRMVRYAIDAGVNYLDTAYVYGDSEVITGKALKDGYRKKTFLATKNPTWNISTMEQLQDNLRIFEQAESRVMSPADQNLIRSIREVYESKQSIGCTGCGYCIPCPRNIAIPEIFKLYNSYQMMKTHPIDKVVYRDALLPGGKGADQCVYCGACTSHCPQDLPIPKLLNQVHEEFVKSS
ncbi:MAG: putative oxidoreductase of aldo/keto reductase family [Bacillota bacterium]|jgi:predicted aldo/keto reductase-like oxidoreductase|nr:putative oxidoreductase of aldo/keto reductase family [Bacillota bacterium]